MYHRRAFIISLIAAASLLFESSLTRLLAVAQYYHFAFLVISLALLGYGASGTFLALVSAANRPNETPVEKILFLAGIGFVASIGIAYGMINVLPFDSYSIAWDPRQLLYLGIYYLVLALPFFMTGIITGSALGSSKNKSHVIYGANLVGSGIGAFATPFVIDVSGVLGAVILSMLIGLMGVLLVASGKHGGLKRIKFFRSGIFILLIIGITAFGALIFQNDRSNSPLGLSLSPYKGLRQALRFPNTEVIYGKWNSISRVDVIQNASIHRLPGLSYQFKGDIPYQVGIAVDADSPQPVTLIAPEDFLVGNFLPESVVFQLKPQAKTLVIEPGGGLGVIQALWGKASNVSVLKENPLEIEAVRSTTGLMNIFDHPEVKIVSGSTRAYIHGKGEEFDIVFYPLTDPYFPVASGAYSLSEDFSYTLEGFMDIIQRLSPNGLLVISRWLQMPPSESIRMGLTLVHALEALGFKNSWDALVMFRGIQTMTLILKPDGWAPDELETLRSFCASRKYDLVWAPDIKQGEVNRHNKLEEPNYYMAIKSLHFSDDRSDFINSFQFDISPPTDNHPFFFHFFKWEQTPEVIATLGHIWQPFGGSGFLVLFGLLAITVVITLILIYTPMLILRKTDDIQVGVRPVRHRLQILVYFSLLGFAFLFVEIPLIQMSILVLEHPVYAFTVVIFVILCFSGLGSMLAKKASNQPLLFMIGLVILSIVVPILYPGFAEAALGWEVGFRMMGIVVFLAPLAVLMGLPFPLGLISLEENGSGIIPWVWAVNGSVSVIASVLSAILILSYGFLSVQLAGGFLYGGALIVFYLGLNNRRR
jgi:hypothetical protein